MSAKSKQKTPTNERILLGENIRNIRDKQDLTQEELAEKANLSTTSISEYENASKEPKIFTLKKIATALGVSIDELCDNTPSSQFRAKLKNSCVFALLTVLEQLKPNVKVIDNTITLTIPTTEDSANYSSRSILNFFKDYELIQNFKESEAKDRMIKLLMEDLEVKYQHLPSLPNYKKDSAE